MTLENREQLSAVREVAPLKSARHGPSAVNVPGSRPGADNCSQIFRVAVFSFSVGFLPFIQNEGDWGSRSFSSALFLFWT